MLCTQCGKKQKVKSYNFCNECFNDKKRQTYKRGMERNPFHRRLIKLKAHCKSEDIKCDLDAEYLASIWTGICPVFGTQLFFSRNGIKDKADNCADLDRFNPELGYVKGNVSWISTRANRIKYNASIQELESILFWMKNWKEPIRNLEINKIIVDGISIEERKKIPRPTVWNKGKKIGKNLKMSSINNPNAKLTMEQVREIRKKYANKESKVDELAKEYNLGVSNIRRIINNLSYVE